MRLRISAAAALVNVTTRNRSAGTGDGPSVIRRMTRSTRTAVFPLPAAAATRMPPPWREMARSCSGVQLRPSRRGRRKGFLGAGTSRVCRARMR